ncbi:MAG TPA: preprotein translocase subunit SecA, partial [Bacteroidia bacterium]|nr:preprotein translocase subunit SecA [Bacteroidia bacterium]
MLEGFVSALSKVFGNKHDRDVKEIQPVIDNILEIEKSLALISDDELRGKTAEFKKRIQDKIGENENKKKELKSKVEADEALPVKEKEEIYVEVDKLEKEILADITAELQDILPEAFAVMRETARRFKEKDSLEVTATEWDKKRSADFKHIKIEGNKAFWKSTWSVRGH